MIVALLCKMQNPANVKFKSNAARHFAAIKKPVPNGTGISLSKNQPKPPLCKGRWQKSLIFDGGVVNETLNISKI